VPPAPDPYARLDEAMTKLAALYRSFQYIQVLQESAILLRERQPQGHPR
jgi:hypothetical protein